MPSALQMLFATQDALAIARAAGVAEFREERRLSLQVMELRALINQDADAASERKAA